MKFIVGVIFEKLSSRHKFLENPCSDIHILRKGINDFLPYISYFLTDLGEIWYRR
jgi:hypothetical protein